jgi:serine O-acetyltransferase
LINHEYSEPAYTKGDNYLYNSQQSGPFQKLRNQDMGKFGAGIKLIRSGIHLFLFRRSSQKDIIEKDIRRWIHHPDRVDYPVWRNLVFLLGELPEYRNLFYYRIAKDTDFWTRFFLGIARRLYRPMETLYLLTPSIGPGFYIQHGFSTIIGAVSIGENCWINQQVTVGFTDATSCPTIGNNVIINAGAKVLGAVTIGDNSKIGANAVVVKDVPPNCTVVGVPAYIVRRDGNKVKEPL